MRDNLLTPIGNTLRERRRARRMTQSMLAARLGRTTSRISELEKDLIAAQTGKDRLALLAEVCDALELVPVLVPRERAAAVRRMLDQTESGAVSPVTRVFDEVFVDLGDETVDAARPPGAMASPEDA